MHVSLTAPVLPAPTGLVRPLDDDQVERHRSLRCSHYEDCLDEAVKRGWESFSCAACPLAPEGCRAAAGELELAAVPERRGRRRGPPPRIPTRLVAEALGEEKLTLEELAARLGEPAPSVLASLESMEEGAVAVERGGLWQLTGERWCGGCNRALPVARFRRHPTGLIGLYSRCRTCRAAQEEARNA